MPKARRTDRWGIVGSKTMFGEMGGHIFKGRSRKGLNLWPMIVLIVLMSFLGRCLPEEPPEPTIGVTPNYQGQP